MAKPRRYAILATFQPIATAMNFDTFFKQRLDALHSEGRYRVFADLERQRGRFPRAFDHRVGVEVTVW